MIQKGKKIHTRKIDIATYEGAEDSVVVEGILVDDRMFGTYKPTGKKVPPGTVHHLVIRMEVKGPLLIIEDIEVEMPTVPLELCRETLDCLEPVKGVRIVSGYTEKIKALVGGVKGCCHLLELLAAMAPATVQGVASAMARKPLDPKIHLPIVIERAKNSCRLWRENGPIMKELEGISI